MNAVPHHWQYGSMGNSAITEPPLIPAPSPDREQQVQWMPTSPAMLGCPPGLECLAQLDQISVHQQGSFDFWETQNEYQIKNALGNQIYFAHEESDCCTRQCFGPKRDFIMHIVDNMNQEVLRVVRPLQCCAGCCWCADYCDDCAFTISVEAPPCKPIGHVRQRSSNWEPHFDIQDANFEPILKIRGPLSTTQSIFYTDEVDFRLMSYDDSQQIGKISKQWTGFVRETFTKATKFVVTFPENLDVKAKGTLLGALFLIDFMFYKQKQTAFVNQ